MNTSVNVGKKSPKKAVVQRLEQTNFHQMVVKISTKMFLTHAVKVAVLSRNKTDDATEVFNLGKQLPVRSRNAVRFFAAEMLDVGFGITIVLAKLFLSDGNFSDGVWNVVWRKELKDGEGGSSVCVTTDKLGDAKVGQESLGNVHMEVFHSAELEQVLSPVHVRGFEEGHVVCGWTGRKAFF